MALLFRQTDVAHEDLRGEIRVLEDPSDDERLAGLLPRSTL
jgi:hypothetical protein